MVQNDTKKSENDRDWSSLPDEIWSMISTHLIGRPLDVLRVRSVCSFFRSLFLPPSPSFLSPPLPDLPRFSFAVPTFSSSAHAFVSRTTLFRLDRPFQDGAAGWIIKIQDPLPLLRHHHNPKFRLLDPLSCHRINELIASNGGAASGFHLNDFRLTELTSSYALRYDRLSSSVPGVNKLIISTNSSSAIFLIYDNGKLGFANNGDADITLIDDKILDFNDLVVHRDQPYVVDRWGTVSWIDKTLKLIQYSPPLFGEGHRKHLVAGDPFLFIVDRYLDESPDGHYPLEVGDLSFNIFHRHPLRRRRFDESRPKTVGFKVYRLDEEWGRWVEVKSLGEKAFLLTYDCCFAVRAKEYVGFKENCIYFTEQFDMDFALRRLGRLGGCVFSMEDGTIEDLPCTPGYSQLFWPPPIPTRLCSTEPM